MNRRAKSFTALQSNLSSLSLKIYCGGPNNMIISFLTNSITASELNKSACIAQAIGHFDIFSTATIRYWFPTFVRSSGLANSMHHVWNNQLTGILPAKSFRFAGFVFRQVSQLFTKPATSCRILGLQKSSLTNEYVELKSQSQTSPCRLFKVFSRISMWSTNRFQYLVRRNNLSL